MLSEDALNRLMQPIIDRQEAINVYVIGIIAKRVKEIGHLLICSPAIIHLLIPSVLVMEKGGQIKDLSVIFDLKQK